MQIKKASYSKLNSVKWKLAACKHCATVLHAALAFFIIDGVTDSDSAIDFCIVKKEAGHCVSLACFML